MKATAADVWMDIRRQSLASKRRRDYAEIKHLLSKGVDEDEAMRRVWWPWKTPLDYRAMCAAWENAFNSSPPCDAPTRL
jgi:hypothetical protein